MQISLNEAIDIHAQVLKIRQGEVAINSSKERAAQCKTAGDLEGEQVWLRVVAGVRYLLDEDRARMAH